MHAVNGPGSEFEVPQGVRTGTVSAAIIFGLLALLLAGCLFGGTPAAGASRWLGLILREVLATFRDPGTQWMVFLCCGVYFTTFALLQHRESGERFWRWGNADVWLAAALVLAAVRYAFGYGELGGNTDALVLVGGAALGKGAAWASGKLEWGEHRTSNIQHSVSKGGHAGNGRRGQTESGRKMDDSAIIPLLLLLLVVAVFWQSEAGMRFQYREQVRWSGPWDNPNVFGMLMGVGLVLALGQLVSGFRVPLSGLSRQSTVRRPSSVLRVWVRPAFYVAAAGGLGFGLVMSYSRGAWVGTAVGLGWLAWGYLSRAREEEKSEVRSPKSAARGRSRDRHGGWFGGFLRRNAMPLAVMAVSLAVLAFWQFRHTEVTTVRRAFSVGNVNDFSWRNRVAAWVGALQMMAERPLTGLGWNQVEPIYNQFYRPSHVHEGMAIQLNDYLTLGAAVGIPALACFLASVGLSLRAKGERRGAKSEGGRQRAEGRQDAVRTENTAPEGRMPEGGNIEHPTMNIDHRTGTGHGAISDFGLRTSDFRSVCRAGALVLLVAFWFDGGLFRLATATVFWLLLEVGRERCGNES